jgi:predicted LPLAT superfamily acyltransferase
MSEWQRKAKGTPLGYKVFIFLLRVGGVRSAYTLLYFVSFYYFLFSHQTSKPILDFYRKKLAFGKIKSLRKLYRNYFLLGQTLIDRVAASAGLSNSFHKHSFGAENLKDMVAMGKGGVLLGSHIGNWGMAAEALINYDKRINILVYDTEQEQIREYLSKVTGGKKYNVIALKDDLSHLYEISEALQQNEIVCMTADRFKHGSRTLAVDFFGEKALLPVGPFQIIKAYKAPYTFVYGIKINDTTYHFFAKPVRDSSKVRSVEEIMSDYAFDLQEMVKQYPEQWFNYYDFWKK